VENPFKYGGVVRGPYFADRTSEMKELKREMLSLNRVFLVSPRRFGKTCLLFNLIAMLKRKAMACVYIDLNAFPDLKSFATALTGQTARALETNKDKLLKMFAGFQKLRPKVTVDQAGNVTAGVELAVTEKDALAALLEGLQHAEKLAAKKERKLVVIIDEFSDLEKFNGQTVEKALRSEIQKHTHIGYIFSGSEQSVMLAMTRGRSRAFYKLGRIMELGPIAQKTYASFIQKWLKKGGYAVNQEDLKRIFDIGNDVPYNVQRLCNVMWDTAMETKVIEPALIRQLPVIVARQDSPHYEMLWRSTTQSQKILMIALSKDQTAKPFSKDFQLTHGIGPSSSIKASLDSLLKKGILYKSLQGGYHFTDGFMPYWIDRIMQTIR
jgi:Ni2+-binding GTPase involved in maturation of urease and hydrogenase